MRFAGQELIVVRCREGDECGWVRRSLNPYALILAGKAHITSSGGHQVAFDEQEEPGGT